MGNRLTREKSPYLLQHADNPVDWFPWGEEAFAKAQRENKPIFLSIGYSTCHWCHVMAHESFESAEVAAVMNREFVNIKVDREERPESIGFNDFVRRHRRRRLAMSIWLTPMNSRSWGNLFSGGSHGQPGFTERARAMPRRGKQDTKRFREGTRSRGARTAPRASDGDGAGRRAKLGTAYHAIARGTMR